MPKSYKIFIDNLRVQALIGVHPHEKSGTQPILINITLELSPKTTDDRLENTLCYERLAKRIESIAQNEYNLVETLAHAIADDCLTYGNLLSVRVVVKKPEALKNADAAGVEIFYTKH